MDATEFNKHVETLVANLAAEKINSTIPLLFMLNLKGQPYTLDKHFVFEPMFRLDSPASVVWKCCRQVGKTQNLTASKLLYTLIMKHYNTLFVCPRFEQVKRVSNDYMKPLVKDSPFPQFFVDETGDEQSVLQRKFSNGCIQYYSYAFLDAERIRGISCYSVGIDEVQDINWDFIPIIAETMSGSPRFMNQIYTGTPKTFDNTIQKLWEQSSQAEWCTKCGCGFWNIGTTSEHLLQMIGEEGVICAKCSKPIDPCTGQWVHTFPETRGDFEGYHISQVTHPIHFQNPAKWKILLHKRKMYSKALFHNECLGESYDSSEALMTIKALKSAAVEEHPNIREAAIKRAQKCQNITIGIDWGGGGEESSSYTAVCVAGQRKDTDAIEVLYLYRFPRSTMPREEIQEIIRIISQFKPMFIAHDYGGAGNIRESTLLNAKVKAKLLIPYTYCMAPTQNVIRYVKAKKGSRSHYLIDKPRSIRVLCAMMKANKVRIPNYDSCREETVEGEEINMLDDFLNLVEERRERLAGSDMILVGCKLNKPDDIVHAVNFACSCIWRTNGKYPNLAEAAQLKFTEEELANYEPEDPNWED
jgi:hypothetical protein